MKINKSEILCVKLKIFVNTICGDIFIQHKQQRKRKKKLCPITEIIKNRKQYLLLRFILVHTLPKHINFQPSKLVWQIYWRKER